MKTVFKAILGPHIFGAVLLGYLFVSSVAVASPRQLSLTRWNDPDSTTQCRVKGLKRDRSGNLIIAGNLIRTNGTTAMIVLKYDSRGTLLWATNYASTEFPPNRVEDFSLDGTGAVVLAGEPDVVKFSVDGEFMWTAPYAGKGLVVDGKDAVIVTGVSPQNIATVKLSAAGVKEWLKEEISVPGDSLANSFSERVAVNSLGEVFVGGIETYHVIVRPNGVVLRTYRGAIFKYQGDGTRVWEFNDDDTSQLSGGRMYRLYPQADGSLVVCASYDVSPFVLSRQYRWIRGDGVLLSQGKKEPNVIPTEVSALDMQRNIFGAQNVNYRDFGDFGFIRIGKLTRDASLLWNREFDDGSRSGYGKYVWDMTLDGRGSLLLAGEVPGPSASGDALLLACDTETGADRWVVRYDGPAGKHDEARAVVVDDAGGIYVAGTSENAKGGADVILLRYTDAPPIRRAGANIEVEFPGPVGGSVSIEGSEDLALWSPLGTAFTDPIGIARYVDSNAVESATRRFYRARQE